MLIAAQNGPPDPHLPETKVDSKFDIISSQVTIKARPKAEPLNCTGDESTQMTRVVFHLFNFVDLIGTRRSVEQRRSIEHVDLTHDGWQVELASLPTTGDNFKLLKAEGGYRCSGPTKLDRSWARIS
jgi:hypothetical protein